MPGGPAAHRTRETPDAREAMEEDDGDEPKRAAVRSLARPVAAAGVCPRPRADGGARCPGPPDSGDGADGPGTACRRSRPARPAPRALNPSPPLPRQSHAERPEGAERTTRARGGQPVPERPGSARFERPSRAGRLCRPGRETDQHRATRPRVEHRRTTWLAGSGPRPEGCFSRAPSTTPRCSAGSEATDHQRRPADHVGGSSSAWTPWPAGSGPHNHAIGRPGLPGRDHDQRAVSSRAPWTTPRCPAGSEATDHHERPAGHAGGSSSAGRPDPPGRGPTIAPMMFSQPRDYQS